MHPRRPVLPRAALPLAALLAAAAGPAAAQNPCKAAITQVERAANVPDRLMQAIAVVESGRRDPSGTVAAWPWTINVEGVGEWFETKAQAIAAVTAHRARGARSIDVGCMQVNLMHHGDAFASLDDAFDPTLNARYAATFLQRLLLQTGSWPRAVGGYHSLTPEIGGEYARKVLAVWAIPDQPRTRPPSTPPASTPPGTSPPGSTPPPPAPPGTTAALPPAGRIVSQPGSAAPSMTGRTLESYRALPTRSLGFHRS